MSDYRTIQEYLEYLNNNINSYSFGVIRDNNYIYYAQDNSYESILIDAATYSGNSGGGDQRQGGGVSTGTI